MRKHLGKISYDPTKQVEGDPEREAARQLLIKEWRREKAMRTARMHIERLTSETGLAQTVRQIFDGEGRPPLNVSLASLTRQHKRISKQLGWLRSICIELELRLQKIDQIRFLHDAAKYKERYRVRRTARDANFITYLKEHDPDGNFMPKLHAQLREALLLEQDAREAKRDLTDHTLSGLDILASRQIELMMKYLFLDHINHDQEMLPDDPAKQYTFMHSGLLEIQTIIDDLAGKQYDLQEFIESADLVAMEGM